MDVTIEKLIYGGEGLAHHDGSTVFVPFVLPRERVAAVPAERKKKFVRARLEKLLEPSAERVAPRCPHFGDCGGCHYQHIPYDAQLQYKAEILRETLRRIGHIVWEGEIALHPSPPWGYRNRAQWKVRPAENTPAAAPGNAGVNPLAIGYFRAHSSALCAASECAILSPLLLKTFLALRGALLAGRLPAELREIEAFSSEDADGNNPRLLMTAAFSGFPSRASELAETFRRIAPEIHSLLFHDPDRGRMELFGPGFLECEVGGVKHRAGHFSFFQVNRFLAEGMVRVAAEAIEGGRLALDLFAGVGLFSLALAKKFERVIAVEANPAAARDLESNATNQGARPGGKIETHSAEAERFLEKHAGKPDFVLLDPPRSGLTPRIIRDLARLAPPRITYISCEPPTLARDLKALRDAGYTIAETHLFDLFPQTFHIEVAVMLRRQS